MSNILIPTLIRSFHNIFTSIWIGGMFVMVLTVFPVSRREIKDHEIQGRVIDEILVRQSKWVYIGIAVLFVSGLLMTRLSGEVSKMFDFSNRYATILSVKHILFLLLSIIALIRSTVFRNAATSKNKTKKKISMALLMINTVVGIVILVLSSMNAVIG